MTTFRTLCVLVTLTVVGSASLGDIILQPSDRDLGDLEHAYAYTWGIQQTIPTNAEVKAASLFFDNIRDWTTEPNVLYIHLLDSAPLGIRKLTDNGSGDHFQGQGTVLTVYNNLPATAQDKLYVFSDAQVDILNAYLADGVLGLGFDPDCHFFNDGVKLNLTIETGSTLGASGISFVPEPATMAFLAVGGGLMLFRRARRGRRVAASA